MELPTENSRRMMVNRDAQKKSTMAPPNDLQTVRGI
jgi:hypothetical protein